MPDHESILIGLSLFLFAAACLGHLILLILGHNLLYGFVTHPLLSDVSRGLQGLVMVAAVPAYWYFWGFDGLALLQFETAPPWQQVPLAYVALCWLTALVLFPAVTLQRLLRKPPAVLAEERVRVLDVAKELGQPPIGNGRRSIYPHLPGNELYQIELIERTLRLPRLPPAWDGLTIVQVTDLHMHGCPDRDYFRFVMDRCAEWEPDLVAVTGDIVDSKRHHRWVVPVLGRLRWKVAAFAILGNHDAWHEPGLTRRRLRRIGMRVLGNTWEQIQVRGQPLVVIGQETPWYTPEPDLTSCPPDTFRLCLSHTPDHVGWARRNGVDLMLSGHVHGGQVRLPVVGSVFVPSCYSRRYDMGVFDEAPTVLHVSKGMSGEQPWRYRCRPEVVRLTLRCGERSSLD